ncbi:polar growth protein [Lithohypha guttulata]|uniref:polar growth protein n=1 Tax=Lithohypha guttulata TaxID=1690604 RepID=UPI002DE118F4|nr:polar growth protein [Lithohypha guttulata]
MALLQNGLNGRALQPGDILLVIHDFDARSADELTLRRSERVELIDLDDGFNDGWFMGRHLTRGGTGLFPAVYTTKAPLVRHTPNNSASYSVHNAPTVTNQVPRHQPANESAQLQPQPLTDGSYDSLRSSLPTSHHTTCVQRSIGETLNEHEDSDSPVMNETLNVIDEHITDLSTPRQTTGHLRVHDDSESEYSSHLDQRSYLAGPETDDEDNVGLDEVTVRSWDHIQTSRHLRDIGVDPKHCDIFIEQEISGDVLLDMDQNFIYMKDFDFGVMGKRLKTWHKIRDFQCEVKSHPSFSRRTSDRKQSIGHISRASLGTSTASLPRNTPLPQPITEEPNHIIQPLQPIQGSKRTSWAGAMPTNSWKLVAPPESSVRPETATTRHSKRHSSIDFGAQPDLEFSALSAASPQNKLSTDRTWSVAGTGSTQATTPASSIRPSTKVEDARAFAGSPNPVEQSPLDVDRGYFSGNELDNRKMRNRLSKAHSRQTSLGDQQSRRTSIIKKHSRLSSAGSVREDSVIAPSVASDTHHAPLKTGRFRSSSARVSSNPSFMVSRSPAVTNLENNSTSNVSIGSPAAEKMKMQDRARKLIGLRATSDAITTDEKSIAIRTIPFNDDAKSSDLLASPNTGDTTPSATPSLEIDTPEGETVGNALLKYTSRPRAKSKQRTSAYTHGLLKIPPSEARKTCDHAGWMKKKASGLMTTWKPRLFVLRGRRLSYYYSENDTEERGIIDISAHKVLVANDDPMVTIHASVTGASKASSTPRPESAIGSIVKPAAPTGVFYFKLVPPKTGLSRAVQFTKPAIHYFQVDSIAEGRKWMGEIMKATIEHDLSSFETTNKQRTISLAKARARKERPPALGDTKPVEDQVARPELSQTESGLGIEFQTMSTDLKEEKPAETLGLKPLSTLGLASKTSLARITEDSEKRLTGTFPNSEDKENVVHS